MVIEILTFRLAPGVDAAAFLDADAKAQTGFFYAQPGLVRRTTARSEDGEWVVVSLWGSTEYAQAGTRAAENDSLVRELSSLVTGVEVRRFETMD